VESSTAMPSTVRNTRLDTMIVSIEKQIAVFFGEVGIKNSGISSDCTCVEAYSQQGMRMNVPADLCPLIAQLL